MRILMIGDVVGTGGCEALRKELPKLKQKHQIDFTVVNGENSAQGNGILPSSAQHIFDSGANVITTGNHVFRRKEIYDCLEEDMGIIRPANFSDSVPGRGYYIVDMLKYKIAVINVMGVSNMEPLRNPFDTVDELLKTIEAEIIIVDFHAETTSEKRSLGFYLDGRVTVVAGTHTHVQTADEQILPEGTAYITDLGMCGGSQTVIGVYPKNAIERFRTAMPTRFSNPDSGTFNVCGIVVEIDDQTKKAVSIKRVNNIIEI